MHGFFQEISADPTGKYMSKVRNEDPVNVLNAVLDTFTVNKERCQHINDGTFLRK